MHIAAEKKGVFAGGMLLLVKKLPLVPFSILYGPKGPICEPADQSVIAAIHQRVCEVAKDAHAIFLRIDPNLSEDESSAFDALLSSLNYRHLEQRWTFWNSPRDVYRIDLDGYASCEELLKSIDNDTRRCIRKAAKEGVKIEPAVSEEELRQFYKIFQEFSVGRGFMARGYDYQRKLWERYVVPGRGRLFLAKYEERIIGGLICILFGRKCLAMHMGTPSQYKRLQTYYAYVWASICWAKEMGCSWYSFRGVGTTPTQEAFKRKFRPRVVPLVGYYDFAFKPGLYRLYHWCEFTLLPASWPLLIVLRRVWKTLWGR